MCLPVMNDFGTPEQQARYQARIIRCDDLWCQMFSEPGAGSDVASLATRAVRDGDEWVLNGQKVWTSGAQYCEYGLCVARTDPTQPKHRGLSMFIIDLSLPGVDIRPLRQINGSSHFNEIYLTDVRGEPRLPGGGRGRRLERGSGHAHVREGGHRGRAVPGPWAIAWAAPSSLPKPRSGGRNTDLVTRGALVDLHIRERIQGFIGMRIRQAAEAGRAPGPEGSIAKLNAALISRQAADLAIELAGASGQAWATDDDDGRQWADGVISSPGMGIAGGYQRGAAQHHR